MIDARELTAAEIARLAGVRPSAVTNWRRRAAGFPPPIGEAKPPRYARSAVIAWLDERRIPADSRREGEREGTTYGQRVRGHDDPVESDVTAWGDGVVVDTDRLRSYLHDDVGVVLDRYRGAIDDASCRDLVTGLLGLWLLDGDSWAELGHAVADNGEPHRVLLAATSRLDQRWPTTYERYRPEDANLICDIVAVLGRAPINFHSPRPERDRRSAIQVLRFVVERMAESGGGMGGEFFTPYPLADLMAALAAPTIGDRICDPCCGTGNLLAAAHDHAVATGTARHSVVIEGSGVYDAPLRVARLQLIAQGAEPLMGTGAIDELLHFRSSRKGSCDIVLSNPSFNYSPARYGRPDSGDWTSLRVWPFGFPPRNNANLAWIQHAVDLLSSDGRAAILLPPSSTWSRSTREIQIRKSLVRAGMVEAVVALPPQMFAGTSIPVTLWLLRRSADDREHGGNAVLFVDATELGEMINRTRRALTAADIGRITTLIDGWRRRDAGDDFPDELGFSRSVPQAALAEGGDLNPATWVEKLVDIPASRPLRVEAGVLSTALARHSRDAARIDQIADQVIAELGL